MNSLTIKATNKARQRNEQAGHDDYRRSVRSAARGLWRDDLSIYDFYNAMSVTIRNGFTRAWYDGAASCGILPGELSTEERDRLEQEIVAEQSYILKFAVHIRGNSKIGGGRLMDAAQNVDLWANKYSNIRNVAMGYACGDQKLKWVRGNTKTPCADCSMLSGRVYRASAWRSAGWEPRSRDLKCGGYKCLCSFQPTNEPATPGFPPRRY